MHERILRRSEARRAAVLVTGGLLAGLGTAWAQGGPPPAPPQGQVYPFGQRPDGSRPGPPPGAGQTTPPPPRSAASVAPHSAPALPASAPTVAAPTAPASAQVASGFAQKPQVEAQRARVQVVGRMLEVKAEDSSLNQILRDIARATGMKITGGIIDERVYGTYGPGDIDAVLTRLLDGMGSNMLLVEDSHQQPTELVLTPKRGGPTPPSPFAGQRADDDDNPDVPPQLQRHVQSFTPTTPPPGQPAQAPGSAPETPAAAAPAATAVPGTTTVQSPNGVKTPQEIYEQLMKMQQGTAKPGTTTTPQ